MHGVTEHHNRCSRSDLKLFARAVKAKSTFKDFKDLFPGNIVEATPDKPYLCFKLSLDATGLWDIIDQLQRSPDKKESSVRGLFVSDANAPLIECATRLTRLLDTPEDIPFLAPMMIRELYYRLLMSEHNEAVWQIATSGSHMQLLLTLNSRFSTGLETEKLAALMHPPKEIESAQ